MAQQTFLSNIFGARQDDDNYWLPCAPVANAARAARVASAPTGVVQESGAPHFETNEQFMRWLAERTAHVESRASDAAAVLEMIEDSRARAKEGGKKRRRNDIASSDSEDTPERAATPRQRRRANNGAAAAAVPRARGAGAPAAAAAAAPSATGGPSSAEFNNTGVRMLRNLLAIPVTRADEHRRVEDDAEEGLVYIPVPCYEETMMHQKLGEPPAGQDFCFICAAGGAATGTPQGMLLINTWRKGFWSSRPWTLAQHCSKLYQEKIQIPMNDIATRLRKPNLLLPDFHPATLALHFLEHDRSPEAWLMRMTLFYDRTLRTLETQGVHVMNAKDHSDRRVCEKMAKLHMQMTKLNLTLRMAKPSEMVGYVAGRSGISARGPSTVSAAPITDGTEDGNTLSTRMTNYYDDIEEDGD